MKLVRLIKMCLNETYSKVRIGKHLSDSFSCPKWFKARRCAIIFALEYAIRKVQENHAGLKLNETHQLLAYADDVNLLGDDMETVKKNTETLIDASKEFGLEVNVEKTKYMMVSQCQNAGQNQDTRMKHGLQH
jgi:hypothetical protein